MWSWIVAESVKNWHCPANEAGDPADCTIRRKCLSFVPEGPKLQLLHALGAALESNQC
jgi:hypothetical protein